MTIEEYDAISSATTAPEATASPEVTAAPTEAPAETAKPTAKPTSTPTASTSLKENSPYEKAAEGIYASALVTDVARSVNSNNEDITLLTVYYQGEEVKVPVLDSVTISSAPEEYSSVKGSTAESLQKGDVICFSANIAGDKIKEMALLFRPTSEDIVTGTDDYGVNFEKLYTTGGKVAGQWGYVTYGSKVSKDKYQYAFGVVARKDSGAVTLINKSKNPDDAIEIDLSPNAYVYTCDVSGEEYTFENGGISDITTSLPSKLLNGDTVELSEDYSYNYAFVRMVEGTATDVVLFNGYNE
ncbi:MAG: hypothetical protein IJH36_02735 [Clostridia bacterium]|nr:hypothetical protein [Clostridia bacterium]